MPKKIAFVFDEHSKNDVSSDDIDELIELSDGRYIVIPKLQGATVCSPTMRAADEATCSAKYHAALAEKGDTYCGFCLSPLHR
jgi:hypothetical protein